jgi:hypothetical protein
LAAIHWCSLPYYTSDSGNAHNSVKYLAVYEMIESFEGKTIF